MDGGFSERLAAHAREHFGKPVEDLNHIERDVAERSVRLVMERERDLAERRAIIAANDARWREEQQRLDALRDALAAFVLTHADDADQRILKEIVPRIDALDDAVEWDDGRLVPPDGNAVQLLKLLALRHSDRAGYRQEWAPHSPTTAR